MLGARAARQAMSGTDALAADLIDAAIRHLREHPEKVAELLAIASDAGAGTHRRIPPVGRVAVHRIDAGATTLPGADDGPTWVLLPVEATGRGFRNPLAFRRWCAGHGVKIRKDGRKEWVRRSDVDYAIENHGGQPDVAATQRRAVGSAIAAIKSKTRR